MKSNEYIKQQSKEAIAWQSYLSQFNWDYFATFTFSEQYSQNGARRAFERFIRKPGIRPVQACFFGIERGAKYGRIHLHGLFQYLPEHRPAAQTIWKEWFQLYGRAKVEIPECQNDVASYTAKYASKDMYDYDMLGKPIKRKY